MKSYNQTKPSWLVSMLIGQAVMIIGYILASFIRFEIMIPYAWVANVDQLTGVQRFLILITLPCYTVFSRNLSLLLLADIPSFIKIDVQGGCCLAGMVSLVGIISIYC
jgi:hypothetical protein